MGNPKYKNGFTFVLHEDALDVPLQWKQPRKIFVNSMSDLFHESMSDDFLVKCFEIMTKADWHLYQILTKRPEKMLRFAKQFGKIPDHIWFGTSVELALYAHRIETLRKVNVRTKFVSFEPLLGPVGNMDLSGIAWAIAGGESGPQFRPVNADWIREIRDQCNEQGIAFFFKQWGGRTPKSGGRALDGREWNEYPDGKNKNRIAVFPTAFKARR